VAEKMYTNLFKTPFVLISNTIKKEEKNNEHDDKKVNLIESQ